MSEKKDSTPTKAKVSYKSSAAKTEEKVKELTKAKQP